MNRRGEDDEKLLANTTGIILAVIILLLLIVGLYEGIKTATSDNEFENAHEVFTALDTTLNALNDKVSINYTLQGYASRSDWYLTAWNQGVPGRPDQCFLENCICICRGGTDKSACEKGECKTYDIDAISVTTPYWGYETTERECDLDPYGNCIDIGFGKQEKRYNHILIPQSFDLIQIEKDLESDPSSLKITLFTDKYLNKQIEE